MSILPKASPATPAKTKESKQIAVVYAVVLVVFALAQLYTFDEFIGLIPSFDLPLGGAIVYVLAPIIVAAEVFALPFLLRMKLSVGFRWFSMVMGWLAAALWLFITLSVVVSGGGATTIGFLGTVVDLVPGWWAVTVPLAMGILAAWASWGLWPAKRAKK